MRKIETTGIVNEQGNLVVPVPNDIPPGQYHVVVVMDVPEQPAPEPQSEETTTQKPLL